MKRSVPICSLVMVMLLLCSGRGVAESIVYQEGSPLHNPNPMVQAGFGLSIASDGNRVLVGAPHAQSRKGETGKAYLFESSSGRLLQTFVPPGPGPTGEDLFGMSVGLAGNIVIIGAPQGRGKDGVANGVVYLYESEGGTLIQTIDSPFSGGEIFGHAIAVQGKWLLVGDPGASSGKQFQVGAAYLFEVKTGRLVHAFQPHDPKGGETDRFGHAVGFAGLLVMVAAPLGGMAPMDSGVVYLFDRSSGIWRQTISSPHPQPQEYFGWNLAVGKQGLVIGAPGHRQRNMTSGAAYVFNQQGIFDQALVPPAPMIGARFGEAVGMIADSILVAAPGTLSAGIESGAVLVFDRRVGRFQGSIGNPARSIGVEDSFGVSISVFNDSLVVGSPFGGIDRALDAGIVHQFRPSLSPNPSKNHGTNE